MAFLKKRRKWSILLGEEERGCVGWYCCSGGALKPRLNDQSEAGISYRGLDHRGAIYRKGGCLRPPTFICPPPSPSRAVTDEGGGGDDCLQDHHLPYPASRH